MHLCKSLLKDDFKVYGIDNMNDYYDKKLKSDRLNQLIKYKNFSFSKIDLIDKKSLSSYFKNINPSKVVNLAAQAGVRYSIENPDAYMNSNLVGFLNLIELCRYNGTSGFIYASSSSVYGGNEKIPFSEKDSVDKPISFYAASKKSNELIANVYSHLYGLNCTGLRFFTVYGPWGRPDMALYIFTKKILENQPIDVFNHGKMNRDFTYIDDIIQGLRSSIDKNYKFEIFNLGNSHSEELMKMISIIEKKLSKKAIINFMDIQPGDVQTTYADVSKAKQMLNYNSDTSILEGIPKFIDWYKQYHK
jgi:UDP-glucuronate 4-epimerase